MTTHILHLVARSEDHFKLGLLDNELDDIRTKSVVQRHKTKGVCVRAMCRDHPLGAID